VVGNLTPTNPLLPAVPAMTEDRPTRLTPQPRKTVPLFGKRVIRTEQTSVEVMAKVARQTTRRIGRRQPNLRTRPLGADSPREPDSPQHSIIACSPGDDGTKTIKTMGRQLAQLISKQDEESEEEDAPAAADSDARDASDVAESNRTNPALSRRKRQKTGRTIA
jgi:hypothetical protein